MSNLVSTQSFMKDKVQEELNRPCPRYWWNSTISYIFLVTENGFYLKPDVSLTHLWPPIIYPAPIAELN